MRHGFTILFYLPSPISSFVSLACVPLLMRFASKVANAIGP